MVTCNSFQKFVLVVAKLKALSSKYKYKAFQRNDMPKSYPDLKYFF